MKNLICTLVLLLSCAVCGLSQNPAPMFYQDIAWSPDGKYLSLTGMHDINQTTNSMKADIYVIKVDGSNLQKITGDATNEFYSSWSSDGKRILFSQTVKDSKNSNLFTVNKDGTGLIQLTKDSKQNSTPAFSPNGKKIAFISTRDSEKYQIYVMNSDGTNVLRLTTDSNIGYFNPMWSHDGKKIVYYAEKGDRKDQIWTMNADGSNQTLLINNIGHNIFPTWSPDGKHILFSSKRDSDTKASYVEGSYLYVMNADGTNIKRVGDIRSFFARFSPDGKTIAYISGKFPETSIYLANADGSGAKKLTN